jgi:hypothetical protein
MFMANLSGNSGILFGKAHRRPGRAGVVGARLATTRGASGTGGTPGAAVRGKGRLNLGFFA